MAECTSVKVASERFLVFNWNDYRKENFWVFLGGFSSLEKAQELQLKCLKQFHEKGWIKNYASCHPILDFDLKYCKEHTKLVQRKFINAGHEDEAELFTVDIIKTNPRQLANGVEQVTVESFWGGWAGLNNFIVDEPLLLSSPTPFSIRAQIEKKRNQTIRDENH